MRIWKKLLCIGMTLALVLGLCACSSQTGEQSAQKTEIPAAGSAETGESGTGEATQAENTANVTEIAENYTFWLYKSIDSSYMSDYSDHPALKYMLRKTYGPNNTRISFSFWVPPAGSANDNFSNMIGSGDYADVIQNVVGDSPLNSYNDGIALDITEQVKQYMPNYVAYLEAHPDLKDRSVTIIDGEEHYLCLASFSDEPLDEYWGHMYRRDWIVKYGVHPVTGETFTGGYTDENDPDSWEDNVVFPSGGSDPIYISDWEWMFDIFQKAQADLGIKDSYCYSVPYNGYLALGELSASFGGLCSGTFGRTLDNEIVFGPVTDQFRTYLQCMNVWYQKGWLDPVFNERTNDMFYSIDSTSVYQGKVGMWFGLNSQLGRRMDNGDPLLSSICAYPAQTPVNDIYGSDAEKYQPIYSAYRNTTYGGELLISTAAKNKDLGALLSFFDTLYTGENAIIMSVGLNAEQCAEINDPILAKFDVNDGAYTLQEDGTLLISKKLQDNMDLKSILAATQMPGLSVESRVDYGYRGVYKAGMELWSVNENIGYYESLGLLSYMTNEENKKYTNIKNKISDYMNVHVPEFIMGKLDPYSDTDWDNWVKMMTKYGYQKAVDIVQPYADAHPYAGYQAQGAE